MVTVRNCTFWGSFRFSVGRFGWRNPHTIACKVVVYAVLVRSFAKVICERGKGIPFCRVNGVDMTKRQFSNTEVEYLRALPAVESVTQNRITYSRDFQISCMRRYLDGERPSSIFTSAGLSPAIVGRKRVERNIARWKADSDIMAAAKIGGSSGSLSPETRERLVSVQLGQIRSLMCQVLELKDRIDALERQLKKIQV